MERTSGHLIRSIISARAVERRGSGRRVEVEDAERRTCRCVRCLRLLVLRVWLVRESAICWRRLQSLKNAGITRRRERQRVLLGVGDEQEDKKVKKMTKIMICSIKMTGWARFSLVMTIIASGLKRCCRLPPAPRYRTVCPSKVRAEAASSYSRWPLGVAFILLVGLYILLPLSKHAIHTDSQELRRLVCVSSRRVAGHSSTATTTLHLSSNSPPHYCCHCRHCPPRCRPPRHPAGGSRSSGARALTRAS